MRMISVVFKKQATVPNPYFRFNQALFTDFYIKKMYRKIKFNPEHLLNNLGHDYSLSIKPAAEEIKHYRGFFSQYFYSSIVMGQML